MKVSELLNEKLIAVPLDAGTKQEAITALVDRVAANGMAQNRDLLLSAVLAREAQRTTGIGRGFAVPHAKCEGIPNLTLAIGRTNSPIDFASIDGKPVSLIALLVSPPHQTGPHLLALAALSRIVINEGVFSKLLGSKDPAEFSAIIRAYEENR